MRTVGLRSNDYLFPSRARRLPQLGTRPYARLHDESVTSIGLDPAGYGTHSMGRTQAALIYRRTTNLQAVQLPLGHSKLESTVRYLGIEVDNALEPAERTDIRPGRLYRVAAPAARPAQFGQKWIQGNHPEGWHSDMLITERRQPDRGSTADPSNHGSAIAPRSDLSLAMASKVILVNGASSSGKTTLCKALQARMRDPFWHYSIDHFSAGVLPWERIGAGEFAWSSLRPAFFDGFHRCLPALAGAGNNLIVEHIVETEAWLSDLVRLLAPFDVFFVGVHCPLAELEARERRRGDRRIGEARNDFATVHVNRSYDFEVDGTDDAAANADSVIAAWRGRRPPGAFGLLRSGMARPGS